MTQNNDSVYKDQFDLLSYSTTEYEQSVPFIESTILPQLPEQKALLDIGAGSGNFSKPLSPLFENTTVVEPNAMYFDDLIQWGKAEGLTLDGHNGDWLDYEFQGEADLTIMSHVLYFVPSAKRQAFIRKAYDSVKEGGFLVIILISATSGISHLYRGLLSPKDYAEMPSIESTLVDMHAQGYENIHLTLFDAVIDIPNKPSMDYLIDFLVVGKRTFEDSESIKDRDSYIERYLRNNGAYAINSNIGLLVLRKA
jgi:SAM-dependent methyltransferase